MKVLGTIHVICHHSTTLISIQSLLQTYLELILFIGRSGLLGWEKMERSGNECNGVGRNDIFWYKCEWMWRNGMRVRMNENEWYLSLGVRRIITEWEGVGLNGIKVRVKIYLGKEQALKGRFATRLNPVLNHSKWLPNIVCEVFNYKPKWLIYDNVVLDWLIFKKKN